jgi:membrane associated rhomboid family serine protease
MSAYSWRERFRFPQHWGRRWAPLVAGVILLGWTGSAGEGTDLVAHLAGFTTGALLGVAAASGRSTRLLERVPQWLAGAAALAEIAVAWGFALRG